MSPTLLRILLLAAFILPGGCTIVVPLGGSRPAMQEVIAQPGSRDKIAIIPITGIIQSTESKSVLRSRPSPVASLASRLRLAEQDAAVKAVLLTINSPGGSVAASDLLYHQLRDFRERSGKLVVAQLLDVGASGGYYSALAADEIHALPTSITCSIGVIVVQVSADKLLRNHGLEINAYTSGERKDAGAPYKAASIKDKQLFTTLVSDFSQQFFELVTDRRSPDADAREYTQGGVCTANQALEWGLIDGIHYPEETIERIRDNLKLDQPTLVNYEYQHSNNPSLYQASLQAGGSPFNPLPESFSTRLTPGIYYLANNW